MLEEHNRIDMVALTKDGKILLVITDAGLTPDPDERFAHLIEKLKCYVYYVVEGDFAKDYPGKGPGDVRIRVMCGITPTEQMSRLTQLVNPANEEEAIEIEYEYFPIDDDGDSDDEEDNFEDEEEDEEPDETAVAPPSAVKERSSVARSPVRPAPSRPTRIWAYCGLLALLVVLDASIILGTAHAKNEVVARLYPLRVAMFGSCVLLYSFAIGCLLRRSLWARPAICVGVGLQFCYGAIQNALIFPQGEVSVARGVALAGVLSFFFILLGLVAWFPFTKTVSAYLRGEPIDERPPQRPRRIWMYCAVLGILTLANVVAIFTSAESKDEVIAQLYPVRVSVFATCALLYVYSIVCLLRRSRWVRPAICVGMALQFGYVLLHNGLLVQRDWPVSEMGMLALGMALSVFLVPAIFIARFPFTETVSAYLRERKAG